MTSKRPPDDEPTPLLTDLDLYAPPTKPLVIAGRTFHIGELMVRPGYQLGRILTRFGTRNQQAYNRLRLETEGLPPEEQNRRLAAFAGELLPALGDDDLIDLLVLILSTPDDPVTPAWVERHVSAAAGLQAISLCLEMNDLAAILGGAKRVGEGLRLLQQAPPPAEPATTSNGVA